MSRYTGGKEEKEKITKQNKTNEEKRNLKLVVNGGNKFNFHNRRVTICFCKNLIL
jgi:hypothetical protein